MTSEELYDEAASCVALGDLEQAVTLYRRSVEANPEFVDGWQALAMALIKTNRIPEAINAAKQATHLRPNDQVNWTTLSLAYNRNNEIEKAEAAGAKAKVISWGGKVAQDGERFIHPD